MKIIRRIQKFFRRDPQDPLLPATSENPGSPPEAPEPRGVKMVSSDGREFVVPLEVFSLLNTFRARFQDRLSYLTDRCFFPLELPGNISGPTFQKVLDWCHYHHRDPRQIVPETYILSPWDMEFLRMDPILLLDTFMAAQSLNVPVLEFVCAKEIWHRANTVV